jgi:tetratricopeptide (TPR) repeat protein
MTELEELKKLDQGGRYRELIDLDRKEDFHPVDMVKDNHKKSLLRAWAHHQLGEYDESIRFFTYLSQKHPADTEIGESARRGLAHGLLQRDSNIEAADRIMQEIPPSPGRDNVRMNIFIMAARKGLAIPVDVAVEIATNVLHSEESATSVEGHILNNAAWAIYETRDQEITKPYLHFSAMFIFAAIGIYRGTGTAKNHIAGAYFRASKICEAMGYRDNARLAAEKSVELWRELVNSQDGARYQQNLKGAEEQVERLTI